MNELFTSGSVGGGRLGNRWLYPEKHERGRPEASSIPKPSHHHL
jgi:hypothetical protein